MTVLDWIIVDLFTLTVICLIFFHEIVVVIQRAIAAIQKNRIRRRQNAASMDDAHRTVMWRDAVAPQLKHFNDEDKIWWEKWGDPNEVSRAAFLDNLIAPPKSEPVKVELRIGPKKPVHHSFNVTRVTNHSGRSRWEGKCACGKEMFSWRSQEQCTFYMREHVREMEESADKYEPKPDSIYAGFTPSDPEYWMHPEQLKKHLAGQEIEHEIDEMTTFGTILEPRLNTIITCTCGAVYETNGRFDPEEILRLHRESEVHRSRTEDPFVREAREKVKATQRQMYREEKKQGQHRVPPKGGSGISRPGYKLTSEEIQASPYGLKSIDPDLATWLENGAP